MSTSHAKAAARFLENMPRAQWHDQALWFVRQKRDNMSKQVPEWEDLRQMGHDIKRYNVTHLADLLEQFEENAKRNGVVVHWAADAHEHNRIIHGLLSKHGVKKLVKSKSMLSEECDLNDYLHERGIEVVETDLGERILQLMDAKPSHIVMPAIHIKRQEVGTLFEQKMGTEPGNSDPTYLTHAARHSLREEFIHADAAMTGGNFAIAQTGEVVVCTNEGNADMGMSCQKLNICAFGIEKVIQSLDQLAVFTRLLARSATGQPCTTYTSSFRKPQQGGELHFVIVDNGRSDILGNPEHDKMLNCIRCGACINTCPVYRRSGGYSYSYFIPGPIGVNLGMLKDPRKYSGNVSACSLCLSCSNVCPVKIDLGEQIYRWRQNLSSLGVANKEKKAMSSGMKFLMERPSLFNTALRLAPVANNLPRFMLYNSLNAWGKHRELPKFASQSFNDWWIKNQKK
ncbi:lactate utilization protein B [Porphyromonas sp. COT-290 OH3588]|uniref:lactate utilization protein B n=1 Tax=Porphyromonas sp. COT-290 OH3588 TaxID=1515617 RepID=UPI00052BB38F|nr:lactate utilization protein B [Porphyromonas sp. COT-290 OH3588]KGO00977.1 4Fe-4S ferredoxin [Porphyromonas sp. COT-290 OH3588]